jgi:hypothetical protein
MAIFDKLKHILFDEDVVEVEDGENELPEREPKVVKPKPGDGIIDHHAVEEDTIAEIKLPKDEDEEPVVEEKSTPVMSRSQLYDYGNDFDDEVIEEEIPAIEESPRRVVEEHREGRPIEPRREVIRETRRDEEFERIAREERETQEVKHNEPRDYKKLISSNETPGKKPFKVTPVISPVYGILDKNYKPEEVIIKTPEPTNNGPREFGPVSYNGDPLPEPIKYEREHSKKDIVSLNKDIDNLKNEEVPRLKEEKEDIELPKKVESKVVVTEAPSVEDEFEPTSEYNKIVEDDSVFSEFDAPEEVIEEPVIEESVEDVVDEEKEPTVDISELIKSTDEFVSDTTEEPEEMEYTSEFENPIKTRDEEIDEDNDLDETIETDLFNLIDSMYKDDEKESE